MTVPRPTNAIKAERKTDDNGEINTLAGYVWGNNGSLRYAASSPGKDANRAVLSFSRLSERLTAESNCTQRDKQSWRGLTLGARSENGKWKWKWK